MKIFLRLLLIALVVFFVACESTTEPKHIFDNTIIYFFEGIFAPYKLSENIRTTLINKFLMPKFQAEQCPEVSAVGSLRIQ